MVEITKGKLVVKVTKGAYNSLYKNEGWKLTSNVKPEKKAKEKPEKKKKQKPKKSEVKKEVVEEVEELDEVETPTEDLEAVTPLSEMTVEEMKAFAKEHDIDLSGVSKAADIRGIIEAETEE